MSSRLPIPAYKQITMPQLRSFCETARLGSMTAAARSLKIAHPTVWKQVHSLEELLGRPLLETHRRGCRPTAAGRTLLALASPLIEGVESLESAFRDACDRRQAKLRLGASPRTLAEDLPDFLVAFAREQPGIQLAVHEVRDSDIIDLVAARRLDLGLSALRSDSSQMPPGLQIEPVFDLDLLLLVPLRHRLARQKKVCLETVPFAELLNDLDLFPSDSVSARLRELAAAGEAKRRFRLTGADTIRRYVRRGMGIGVIGRLPGRKPDRTLVEISLGEHFGPLAVQAVYRENALNQGALQITVKALRDWVKGEGWQAISSEL